MMDCTNKKIASVGQITFKFFCVLLRTHCLSDLRKKFLVAYNTKVEQKTRRFFFIWKGLGYVDNWLTRRNTRMHAQIHSPTRLKTTLKITQFGKVHGIKINELKLTQVQLFYFFHFICVAANVFKLFCVAHLANIERFLCHSNFSF